MTKLYREAYGIFGCTGILFNHESPLRGLEFVTRKISNGAAKIKLGLQNQLALGNLDAMRDWGFAPEYVDAMWLMLQNDHPDDYVISSGECHSVKEFAEKAFSELDLDYRSFVVVDKKFMRPLDVSRLVGDCSKAKRELGWQSRTDFRTLAKIMVNSDLEKWSRWAKGEKFAWDAPNYPDEANLLTRTLAS